MTVKLRMQLYQRLYEIFDEGSEPKHVDSINEAIAVFKKMRGSSLRRLLSCRRVIFEHVAQSCKALSLAPCDKSKASRLADFSGTTKIGADFARLRAKSNPRIRGRPSGDTKSTKNTKYTLAQRVLGYKRCFLGQLYLCSSLPHY